MKILPIDHILPELLETVQANRNILLHAPPGAGKTTRVPLALLEVIPPENGRIIMLEPRRLAAVSAARWMASCLGEEAGQTVGYTIRFDSRTSRQTRIEVVTEGVLTRRIQQDPLLEGVAMVIFDEFHERSIQADLGLALCLDLQNQVRDDLKIMVMSATLDVEPLAQLMGNAPVVSSPGRSFPVEEIYLDESGNERLPQRMAAAVIRALQEQQQGDLLAFLPGSGEIRSCSAILAEKGLVERGIEVHQLYGDLAFEQQQRAIQPVSRRKVILATSIAETSLTIEGVRVVIDSGLSRRLRHDPASGMNRLVTLRESRASAEQRKGRGGRVAPGVCYRLFSRHSFSAMTPHTPAEILETDLSPLVLELAAWGSTPADLTWLDPPPAAALEVAGSLLKLLGALDMNGRLTALGRRMSAFPLHPRLSRLLLRADELSCPQTGCDLAALLSERDIVKHRAAYLSAETASIEYRLQQLEKWRSAGCCDASVDRGALQSVDRVSRLLARVLGFKYSAKGVSGIEPQPETIASILVCAYPDRVARRRDGDPQRLQLSNGGGIRIASDGIAVVSSFIIALSVDAGNRAEGVVHLSADISEGVIKNELSGILEKRDTVAWLPTEGRVAAVTEERLGELQLSARPFQPDNDQLRPVVLQAITASGLSLLSRDESFRQLQARVMLLRQAIPEGNWPDLSDETLVDTLETWLAPYIEGVTTARQLAAVNLTAVLYNSLDFRQRQSLDELAPTQLVVPSGSRIRLDYCAGELPVLAVKLQELFGLAETPTVAGGRVPVLLHLLSPAGRPLQVTQDLRGFWDGSYHQVRKEMKGRYPKHPWPDDPWNAIPTKRTKARMG